MSKKLVAYFSATGVTANVARQLAEACHADLYEIKPQVPYTKADLDWKDKNSRSTIEMANLVSRPAIADRNANIAAYDVIFIAPRFNDKGILISPARITVIHNGVLIQNNATIWGGTQYIGIASYDKHADKLPIILQDHGDLVSFRNIWIRNL